MLLKYYKKVKFKKSIFVGMLLFAMMPIAFAQFVEDSRVSEAVNTPAVNSGLQIEAVFDVLIILAALMFVVSMFGFGIGFLKMVTSGGDEKTAEAGSNMLVLSAWIFGASALSYLIVNVIKYFIY
jgi:hypothetical protein